MRKIIFCFGLFLLPFIISAQQLPLYSQYFWNDYIINPAFSGNTKFSSVQTAYRNQWSGFKGAPKSFSIGVNHLVKNKNVGLSLFLFSDDHGGAIKQTGMIVGYSYKLKLDDYSRIDFGASALVNQYTYDGSTIFAADLSDNTLFANQTATTPDLNLGIAYVYDDNFKIGLSVQNMFQSSLRGLNTFNTDELFTNFNQRQYNLSFSYKIISASDFSYDFYALAKTTWITPPQIDFGSRVFYKGNVYTGLAYRSQDAFSFLVGIKKNRFVLGYAYDITTSKIRAYSTGSHDLVLTYRYNINKNRKFRQRFNYYERF
jgi:type IX secretion system PorP/SprF family membrane protein